MTHTVDILRIIPTLFLPSKSAINPNTKVNSSGNHSHFGSTINEMEIEEEIVPAEPQTNSTITEATRSQLHQQPVFRSESVVYVAVGKMKSSMDALSWVLRHEVGNHPSSKVVYLIHIFPEVRHIPTPLGNLPKNQVNPDQVETHMITVRSKRRELLQKFINLCYSAKVEVDTILIESDEIAKAMLELIPVLEIPMLIIGASKSSAKKLKKTGMGGGGGEKEEVMLKGAPDYCKMKVISEGKEVPIASGILDRTSKSLSNGDSAGDSTGCRCFPGIAI